TAPATPYTLAPSATQEYSVTYKPVSEGLNNAVTFVVTYDSLIGDNTTSNTVSASLSGRGNFPAQGAVRPSGVQLFNLSVAPNPFKSNTVIALTANETANAA